MPSNPLIGIIAEDESDVDAIIALARKIAPTKKIGKKHFVGDGCGKIRLKAASWAKNLHAQGCNSLLVIHDADRYDIAKLRVLLESAIGECGILKKAVIIPIEEVEAWFLSDMNAVRKTFSLKKDIKPVASPHNVKSPKEFLESLVYRESGKTCRYLNTKHNLKLAEALDVEIAKAKCPSFRDFYNYINMITA